MASFVSATTTGGCTFEELCNGTRCNYVCDPSCLVDLRGEENMDRAVRKLIDAVECTFRNLECARDCTVEKFYIGKTFIKHRRKTKFDVRSPYTWKKNGISSRWQEHKKKDYGKDGLVVLAAVTKKCVPGNTHQQQYALCLEQRLLHHFRFHEQDGRLVNSTFATGGETKTKYIAYAVYIAFSLREESSSDISTDEVENNNRDFMSPSVGMSTGISLVATEFDLKRLHLSSVQKHTDATTGIVSTDPFVSPTGARASCLANNISICENSTSTSSTIPQATNVTCSSVSCTTSSSYASVPTDSVCLLNTATSVPPTVLTMPYVHIVNAVSTVPAKSTSTAWATIQYTTSKINTTTLATNTNPATGMDNSISPEPSRVSTDPSVSPTRARASCLANTSDRKNSGTTKRVLFATTVTSTIPQATNVTSSSVSCTTSSSCATIPADSVRLSNIATIVPPLIPVLTTPHIHVANAPCTVTGTYTAGSTIPVKSTSTNIQCTPTTKTITTTSPTKYTNSSPIIIIDTSTSPADPSTKKPKTDKPANNPPPKGKQRHTDATRVAIPSVIPTGARVSSIANTTATSVPPTVIPALTIPHIANAPCTVPAKSTSTMRANIQYTTSKITTTLATNTNPTTSTDNSISPEPSRVSTDPSVSPTRARASCLANTSDCKNSTGTSKRVLFATTVTSTIPQATNVTSSSVSCRTTSSSCATIPADSVHLSNIATSVPPLIPVLTTPHIHVANAPCTVTGTYTAGSTIPVKSTSTNIQHTPTANRITTTSTTKYTNSSPIIIIDTSTSPADPSTKKPKTNKPANNPPPKGKQRHTDATRVAIPSVIPTGARVSSIANTTATSVPPTVIPALTIPHIANAPCTVTGTYTAGSTIPAKSTSTSIQYTTSRNTTSGVVVTSMSPLQPSKKKSGGTSAKVIFIHKHIDLTNEGNKSVDSTTSLFPDVPCRKRKAEDVQYTTKKSKITY